MTAPRLALAEIGQRVFAYKNLTRGCWSLKALDGAHKGKVVAHLNSLTLADASPLVKASQVRWMRANRSRLVCCGITGTLAALDAAASDGRRVTFHPYERDDGFYADTGETFTGAARMTFTQTGAYAHQA